VRSFSCRFIHALGYRDVDRGLTASIRGWIKETATTASSSKSLLFIRATMTGHDDVAAPANAATAAATTLPTD
jgi:uncharacterized protein YabE (DUF348 family)